MKNPVWVAAQTPLSNVELYKHVSLLKKYVHAGASAIETDCITPLRLGSSSRLPVIIETLAEKSAKPFGHMGFFIMGPPFPNLANIEYGISLVQKLKNEVDVPIIANMMGEGLSVDSWSKLALELSRSGADMLELNLSCPNIDANRHGYNVGKHIEHLEQIVASVIAIAQIPVTIKLSPELDLERNLSIATKCVSLGVKGIVLANAPISIAPPKIKDGGTSPYKSSKLYSFSGTYGPWDRFLCYRLVASTYAHFRDIEQVDISAVGGIVEPEHAVQLMMLGAKTIQLSSGVMWKGYGLIKEVLDYIKKYLKEKDFGEVTKLVGISQRFIKKSAQEVFQEHTRDRQRLLNFKSKYVFETDGNCEKCELCLRIPCLAIEKRAEGVKVDPNLCSGCGWCRIICPQEAFIQRRRK